MEDIDYLNEVGISLFKEGKYVEALDFFKQCEKKDQSNPDFNYNIGLSYHRLIDHQNALQEYKKAIEKKFSGYDPFYQCAEIYFAQEDFTNAILFLNIAIEMPYRNEKLFFLRGSCYRNLLDHEKAVEDFTSAINQNNQKPEFYYNRGIEYFLLKKYIEAEKDYTTAINLSPLKTSFLFRRSEVYVSLNNFESAIEDLTSILDIEPENLKVLIKRGYIFGATHNYKLALKDFEAISVFLPNQMDWYLQIGICHMLLGNLDSAIKNFSRVIDGTPENFEAITRKGMSLFLQKDYINAKLDLRKSISLLDETPDKLKHSDSIYYTLGLILLEEKNYSESIEHFKKCKLSNFLVFLSNYVDLLPEKIKLKLFKYFYSFNEIVLQIKKEALYKIESSVCHYSSLSVADTLVMNAENALRFYNVIYMNDPEEGQILFGLLNPQLSNVYNKAKEEEEFNIYLGSFLPSELEDNLVMWRTYGKQDNAEAKGCSITFSSSFFDKGLNMFPNKSYKHYSNKSDSHDINFSQPLYRVLYIDKKSKKVIDDNDGIINEKLEKLNSSFVTISNFVHANAIHSVALNYIFTQVINSSLSEIIYLFKSADFSYEKELRVILVVPMESPLVNIDNSQFPKKLYIESNREIRENIESITLGPKVENPSHWVYLKAKLKKDSINIDLRESKCKFK